MDELTLTNLLPSLSGQSTQISTMLLNFCNSSATRKFWETNLLPYWTHRDRPKGQRFMGSFKIDKSATDELMKMVGENLRQVGNLTENRLQDRFGDTSEAWVKTATLALSEYAYHYSESHAGFWQGFCQRLNLACTQEAENTLRSIVDRGVDTLGLIRAKAGYRYVSTLWLQSGIPQKNLDHFAQLIQNLQAKYGWEHLAEADHTVLSEILLDNCPEQQGTLKNFLQSSCSSSDTVSGVAIDPISGQLVQGIAVVARELERQNLSPQVLLDAEKRESLLASFYLPRNFFLRSWKSLIQVITLSDNASARRRLISLRPKQAFLELDLESRDTRLILPEQTVWKSDWKSDLRGTYCQIPEAEWEETFPQEGGLNISELSIPVETFSERWNYTLLNHNHAELHKWSFHGTSDNFACLIFDAITGKHIALSQSEPVITGVSEILCFTPKESVIEPGLGIELREKGIPSSLRGWRGVHLERITSEATITFQQVSTADPQLIRWKKRAIEPTMQGLRLLGRRPIYLEAPTLWFPLMTQATTVNVLLENKIDKSVALKQVQELPADELRSLSLQHSIQSSGHYEIKLWNPSYRWSQRFEVRDSYCMTQPPVSLLKVSYQNQDCTRLPIQVETSKQFWAAHIQLLGLWVMNPVTLWLSNGRDEVDSTLQADRTGSLEISLAQFYEFLPQSESYVLSYQLLGQERTPLIAVGQSTVLVPLPTEVLSVKAPAIYEPPKPPPPQTTSNWYLITVKPYKRDVFCKQLRHRLENNNVENTGVINFEPCTAEIYADYILAEVKNNSKARATLQGLEHFTSMERRALKEEDVKRMLRK
jgi:hypothetical protein